MKWKRCERKQAGSKMTHFPGICAGMLDGDIQFLRTKDCTDETLCHRDI